MIGYSDAGHETLTGENNMNWYPNLYLGKTAKEKKEKLIQKIESGKTPINTYLLMLASGEANQLEIIPAWNLKFWHDTNHLPMIIGIGCGRRETFELVRRITEEVYQETKDVRLREYFEIQS